MSCFTKVFAAIMSNMHVPNLTLYRLVYNSITKTNTKAEEHLQLKI